MDLGKPSDLPFFSQFLSALLGMTAFNMGTGLGKGEVRGIWGELHPKPGLEKPWSWIFLVFGDDPKAGPWCRLWSQCTPRPQQGHQGVGQAVSKITRQSGKNNTKITWHNPQLRRDAWENTSPDTDHCSLYEFTWLIIFNLVG